MHTEAAPPTHGAKCTTTCTLHTYVFFSHFSPQPLLLDYSKAHLRFRVRVYPTAPQGLGFRVFRVRVYGLERETNTVATPTMIIRLTIMGNAGCRPSTV